MARKSRINIEEQVKMEGTDTELSQAADELLECERAVVSAQAAAQEVESRMVDLMEGQGLKTMNHEGRTFTVRETNITRRTIVVGKARTV